MIGTRPLTDQELVDINQTLSCLRDKALFTLGYCSGFRISELLSLKVQDVFQHGKVVERITVQRKHMKKQTSGRTVLLHPKAVSALSSYLNQTSLDPSDPLFLSAKGGGAISRIQAWRIYKAAFQRLKLGGKLGTHSTRKTFADKMYKALDKDLIRTQRALGHANVNSTVSYLSFNETEIDEALLSL